jgi:hypothetical protein
VVVLEGEVGYFFVQFHGKYLGFQLH